MTTELTILAWTLILALLQILLTSSMRTLETGAQYNAGARDNPGPPVGKLTGRLQRAQKNLFETLPLFIAAVLIAHLAGRNGVHTLRGAELFLLGRVIYLPLYALGIPYLRTLLWLVSMLGLGMVLWAILVPF